MFKVVIVNKPKLIINDTSHNFIICIFKKRLTVMDINLNDFHHILGNYNYSGGA